MYYVYKTINKINHKIYIGVHKSNNIKNDNYIGSGIVLKRAIKKYGISKFKKEILFEYVKKNDAYNMEAKVVNNIFIERFDTYNTKLGGEGGWEHIRGKVSVRDKNGNTFSINKSDYDPVSSELISVKTGFVTVRDINGNCFDVNKNDPRYLSGELKHNVIGYKHSEKAKQNMSESQLGNKNWLGKTHSKETKQKISNSHKGKHVGKLNSQYGTCWIMNEKLKENKKIRKEELQQWINKGWIKGRKIY